MILKGSQRGGGKDLAAHLMKVTDNEHVRVHEMRGFSCETLRGAFQEIEATSRATRCRQYLFSLSLSPPSSASVGVEQYEAAIARVEDRLGLDGQPRAIVFHEKEGRRHAHCVWSRIDTDAGMAVALPFFKTKLMGISRDLYLEHGWSMPRGIAEAGKRDPTNFTLAEWQQAKRNGQDPRWLKSTVQDCWNRSDGKDAFARAMEDRGLSLARGDRRSHVIVDFTGEVHALSRAVALKTKDVRARLGDGADLPSVEKTLGKLANLMSPAMHRHVEESRARFDKQAAKIERQRTELVERQRQERRALDEAHKRRVADETKALAAAMPRGFKALWARINGQYKAQRLVNEAQTQRTRSHIARERQRQAERQQGERQSLQAQIKALRDRQAEQLLTLRGDIGRFAKMRRAQETPPLARERGTPSRDQSLGLKLER